VKSSLSKQQLLLFGLPVAGLLVGLLGYVALVAPQKSQAKSLASEIATAQVQLATAQHKSAKAPKPPSAQAADLFRLTKAMPDSDDMPGILRQLSRIARTSSVKLESVKPSQHVPVALGYGALPVLVTVSGKFADVSTFLQQLRQQVSIGTAQRLHVDGRLFLANQVQLTTTDGGSVSAILNLDAFVYGVAPPTPPPPAPSADGSTPDPAASSGSGG
jgi:Tfp pilus assembly protein PilO